MQIVSYNVNGIRSAVSKGLLNWMEERKADVYCFQETKADRSQIDHASFDFFGYNSYWFSAQKKGYSGVAIFTKRTPDNVVYGFGDPEFDGEGRIVRADFGDTSVISVYIPSGSSGEIRQAYKMVWLDYFYNYIETLKQQKKKLIICGDYNICHQPIDIHDPVSNKNSSGFLPEEREWLSKFIDNGFVDTFRKFHPEPHQYSWWTFRAGARERNKGWRIDYCMTTPDIEVKDAGILQQVKHSDHCPVWVEL
ncbi:MAG: exodeoxyribonuclease III [Bacteroidota bacterium]